MSRYIFVHSCPSSTYEDIQALTASEKPISLDTFRRAIGPAQWAEIQASLGYDRSFPIRRDWHVGYFRGVYRGVAAVFLRHSRIEHIFTLHGMCGPSLAGRSAGRQPSLEGYEQLAYIIAPPNTREARAFGPETGRVPLDGIAHLVHKTPGLGTSHRFLWMDSGVALAGLQVMQRDRKPGTHAAMPLAANVYTRPSARRMGLASKLFAHAEKTLRTRIAHSDDLSEMGRAWTLAIEARRPSGVDAADT
jgi:GNAT superfamily N-acetyltransferase